VGSTNKFPRLKRSIEREEITQDMKGTQIGAIAVDPLMLATEFGCCAHVQLVIVAFQSHLGVNICVILIPLSPLFLLGILKSKFQYRKKMTTRNREFF